MNQPYETRRDRKSKKPKRKKRKKTNNVQRIEVAVVQEWRGDVREKDRKDIFLWLVGRQ